MVPRHPKRGALRTRVNCSVAVGAQSDQIALGVIASLASALNVVDLEPTQGAASLAAPAIAL
jgi:hypothetical protein